MYLSTSQRSVSENPKRATTEYTYFIPRSSMEMLVKTIYHVDKCSSHGIRKSATSSVQVLPNIINKDLVPTVKLSESFKYLGRYSSFSIHSIECKTILLDPINNLLTTIDNIPCNPKNKLLLSHRFALFKISWHLIVADVSKTWVV